MVLVTNKKTVNFDQKNQLSKDINFYAKPF